MPSGTCINKPLVHEIVGYRTDANRRGNGNAGRDNDDNYWQQFPRLSATNLKKWSIRNTCSNYRSNCKQCKNDVYRWQQKQSAAQHRESICTSNTDARDEVAKT
ncbi:hypothetical protein EC9_38390 [Rosistilla ulvae]|uniref:Uncharacterized protein n=1 Tax=Rosistilla ulvae TaxID=1930277 RepID=A0A517M444_9BACT|nr:hypothetical protein EC9_38390 [Rosistilla ulvae]